MRKIISVLLTLAISLSLFVSVSVTAADMRIYGVDNLNSEAGDLIIGYIGGSITEGAAASSTSTRYSTLVVNEYFKKQYPNKNVVERNAAIGGTGSDYGMVRMRKNLKLDSAQTPDVVFVEYAVNDSGVDTTAVTQNMESIVRQLLSLPKIPAIVFIYTTRSQDNTGAQKLSTLQATIDAHHAVAERYGIYEINIDDYIWEGIAAGKWVWTKKEGSSLENLTTDGVHPIDVGNRVYADFIVDKLTKDKSKAFVKLDPDTPPCGEYVYGEIEEIPLSDPSVKLSSGWSYVPVSPVDINERGNYIKRFYTDGYCTTENCVGQTIELEFTGRGFGLDVNRTPNNGRIEWKIYDESGNLEKSGVKTYYYRSDGGRNFGSMVVSGLPYGKHKLVLTGVVNESAIYDYNSSGGTQGGKTGTYLAIGYIAIEKTMPEIAPVADNVKISGDAVTGKVITGDYDFSCKMYSEGSTVCGWYASDRENGAYTLVETGETLALTAAHKNKYIKFGVIPVNSEGKAGKLVYSDAILVTRPLVSITLSDIAIKVNGSVTDVPVAGKNTFSATVSNSDVEDRSITVYAVVYAEENGVKTMSGIKSSVKSVPAQGSAEIAVDFDVNDGEIVKVFTVASDNLEPAVIQAIQYMGKEAAGSTDIYMINSL